MYNNSNDLADMENFILYSEKILSELSKKSSAIKARLSIKSLKNSLTLYVDKFAG